MEKDVIIINKWNRLGAARDETEACVDREAFSRFVCYLVFLMFE